MGARPRGLANVLTSLVALALVVAGSQLVLDPAAASAAPAVTGVAPRSGPVGGGQSITLAGRGLSRVTSVLFGSVRTTRITVVSDTRLTVTTPAHGAGRVYVRATTRLGTSPIAEAATYIFMTPPYDLALGRATAHRRLLEGYLSCASATFCVEVGSEDLGGDDSPTVAQTWNGTSWSATTQLRPTGPFDQFALSCAASPSTGCILTSAGGETWYYDGSTWTTTTAIPGEPRAVDCPLSTYCFLVTGAGDVYTWNGTTWSSPDHLATSLSGISCPTTTFCQAITGGDGMSAVQYRDGAWLSWTRVTARGTATGISCTSLSFCMVAGDFGSGRAYLVWTGRAWSPPQPGDQTQLDNHLPQCPSPTFCLRSRIQTTQYEVWNGASRVLARPHTDDTVVSCWAAYSCMFYGRDSSRLTSRG